MSYANGLITEPIESKDPYMVMGVGQYNGWWDITYICSNGHRKINMFASHKPVNNINPEELIGDNILGEDVNYNINISYTSQTYLPSREMQEWAYYNVPNTHFCRITDFIGYNHHAVYPLDIILNLGDIVAGDKYHAFFERNADVNAEIDITKILVLRNKYFGIAIRNINTDECIYKTCNIPITSNINTGTRYEVIIDIPAQWKPGAGLDIWGVVGNTLENSTATFIPQVYSLNQCVDSTAYLRKNVFDPPAINTDFYVDIIDPESYPFKDYGWNATIRIGKGSYTLGNFYFRWQGTNVFSGNEYFSPGSTEVVSNVNRSRDMTNKLSKNNPKEDAEVTMTLYYNSDIISTETFTLMTPPDAM